MNERLAKEIYVAFAAIGRNFIGLRALFRFEDETAFSIGVGAPETGRAVAIVLEYAALET